MIELLAIPLALLSAATGLSAEDTHSAVPEEVTVTGRRVANLQPASSFSSTATALRFDPQINLQARGLPEGQADITVRGGLFENTGFRLGAVTVTDPQTGHYAVEIPLDPAMLSAPEVMTGFDNSLSAFNATVATVNYAFNSVVDGGRASAGAGSDSLYYLSARTGHRLEREQGGVFGMTLSAAISEGDGTLPNGDHDFKRFSGQLQWQQGDRQTQLLIGYHDKFAGWPGMYTGFASLPETDHTKLGLLILDHSWNDDRGGWQLGTYYRWLENDYDFDRRTQESGTPGSFEHETRSFAVGLSGQQAAAGVDWYINGQLTADRLVRSTDLTNGFFNSRTYLTLSLAPGHDWRLESGSTLALRAGLRADFSNRDENALMPMVSLVLEKPRDSAVNRYELDLSRTSQLPGYTALNSRPQGLFGGNPNLGREYANTLSAAFTHQAVNWLGRASAFFRQDDDLVDWTYRTGAPFVRQANPVDIDVTGVEGLLTWQGRQLDVTAGYAWLHKDADYGSADVDASYYALNFAEHRATLALTWSPLQSLELRMDNEFRIQQENLLRSSRDRSWITSLSLTWQPASISGLQLIAVADNLTDDEFQEFPGTPPTGRQFSLGIDYGW